MVLGLILPPVAEDDIVHTVSCGKAIGGLFHPGDVIGVNISVQVDAQAVDGFLEAVVSEKCKISPGDEERLDLILDILIHRHRDRNVLDKSARFR